ncbi:MAG: glycosyltransferase family 4 protein [Chloroflexales bacterium]|nr:glycosyltransferase family 4 protein [Chloroflexales bacterium]
MVAPPSILVGQAMAGGDYDAQVAADAIPRQDYLELARAIGGVIVPHPFAGTRLYGPVRLAERRLSFDIAVALRAALRARRYSVLVSTSEKTAVPLASALRALGTATPHIVIGHKLSSGLKTLIWRHTRLQRDFTQVICVSRAQADYAAGPLGLGRDRAHFVYDKVDQRFFRPLPVEDEPYVLAVGQEQRDYSTLLRALAGTEIRLVVIASSPWANSAITPAQRQGVKVLRNIPYWQLRELYARARVVALPLHDVDYAAGANGLLEAMAMGRPVVASGTQGLAGYIEPDTTAIVAPPGDALALRDAISRLWGQPQRRAAIGAQARAVVESTRNLDTYIAAVAQVVSTARSGATDMMRMHA